MPDEDVSIQVCWRVDDGGVHHPESVQVPCADCGELLWKLNKPGDTMARMSEAFGVEKMEMPEDVIPVCIECGMERARAEKDMTLFYTLFRLRNGRH